MPRHSANNVADFEFGGDSMQDDDVLVGLITDGIVMNGRWIIKRWRVWERIQKESNKKILPCLADYQRTIYTKTSLI
jgi:hypothetical protein